MALSILNKSYESGYLCLVLDLSGNASNGLPLIIMLVIFFSINYLECVEECAFHTQVKIFIKKG